MEKWNFNKPEASDLGDHDVFVSHDNLKNKRVALIITGGIAAIKAPLLSRMLRRYGADVVVYASENALRFTTIDALEWSTNNKVVTRLTSSSEHLSDNNPFDVYLVAPATANIINKMAVGIADGAVSTTMAVAIGRMEEGRSKILVAPTMHHTLHTSILTDSLKKLNAMGVKIITPRMKNGKHNIPNEIVLVSETCREVSDSVLKGKKILVTGGPTPTPIDNVRRIINRFRGKLGIKITEELYLRGADVMLVHGDGALQPPKHLPYVVARTYNDYLNIVLRLLHKDKYKVGIFSAAVADYQTKNKETGKIPSGQNLTLELEPTSKVIDMVRNLFPDLMMVSFKYNENITHEELVKTALSRIYDNGHRAVVINRGEETGPKGEQIAHLLSGTKPDDITSATGKENIAKMIVNYLENQFDITRKDT